VRALTAVRQMNTEDASTAYVQVTARAAELRSLRDLRGRHVGLLEEMRRAVLEQLRQRQGFAGREVRLFLHYFPTFWRLHLHAAHLRCAVPAGGLAAGRAVLLEDVLQNLRMHSDYYAEATLVSSVREGTPHHAAFLEAGIEL
jgi:m7GpppX diphosphatase